MGGSFGARLSGAVARPAGAPAFVRVRPRDIEDELTVADDAGEVAVVRELGAYFLY